HGIESAVIALVEQQPADRRELLVGLRRLRQRLDVELTPRNRHHSPHVFGEQNTNDLVRQGCGAGVFGGYLTNRPYSSALRLPLPSRSAASNCLRVSCGQICCASSKEIRASKL